ncbi:hypothetical protein CDL15_Pgr019568 [Punica granatum]|uniref:BAH domain-containing protein n=1 Tax=Punica granatum TaxID=22663 RepID=A0A218X676_PUNGR|nr:hypothetical protein CDL15_Pgr019568 [Punica granatum]
MCVVKPPWPKPELPDGLSSPIQSNPSTKPSEVSPQSPLSLTFAGKISPLPEKSHLFAALSAGDCVLMRPSDPSKPSYVARIERIESDSRGANVKVHVRWYYRPEESIGGRRQFHGSKEVFLSDHYDVQSADTIEGKCTVHTFKSYTKLDAVGNDDFFCRFEYNSSTGAFNPDRVAVYCKCEMPYNPDDLMVQCEGCSDCYQYMGGFQHASLVLVASGDMFAY